MNYFDLRVTHVAGKKFSESHWTIQSESIATAKQYVVGKLLQVKGAVKQSDSLVFSDTGTARITQVTPLTSAEFYALTK